jgi:hypothetical protein
VPSSTEGPCFAAFSTHQKSFTYVVWSRFSNYSYRGRWDGVGETYEENFDTWAERVASRTLEGLEGYDTPTQIEGNEQTGHHCLAVQARAFSQEAIGAWFCGVASSIQNVHIVASCMSTAGSCV